MAPVLLKGLGLELACDEIWAAGRWLNKAAWDSKKSALSMIDHKGCCDADRGQLLRCCPVFCATGCSFAAMCLTVQAGSGTKCCIRGAERSLAETGQQQSSGNGSASTARGTRAEVGWNPSCVINLATGHDTCSTFFCTAFSNKCDETEVQDRRQQLFVVGLERPNMSVTARNHIASRGETAAIV